MLKSIKNRRLLSLIMALAVIGSVLCGAVVPGLASGGGAVASGSDPGASVTVSSVTVSDENVTLTLKQTEANKLSVSGSLINDSADIYGGMFNVYVGDYVFTVQLDSAGKIAEQPLGIDYSYCVTENSVLDVCVKYSLKVSEKYVLKTTSSVSFGVITYLPELGLIGAPAGTTYVTEGGVTKVLADKNVPSDIVKNEDESFVLTYNGGEILLKKTSGGLSQSEKEAKKRFEELYAQYADKLYDRVTETVEATASELTTLMDAYLALPDTVRALSAIREKYDNIVLSEFIVVNMDILLKTTDELTSADELAIDRAFSYYAKLSASDKTLMSGKYNDLLAKKKFLAVAEITEFAGSYGSTVAASKDEYVGKINASETDTPAKVDALVNEFKDKFEDIVRDEALAELEAKYNSVTSLPEYSGFSESSKAEILSDYEVAKDSITNAVGSDVIKADLAEGILKIERRTAYAKILAFVNADDSTAVYDIVNSAYDAIYAETDSTKIDGIVKKAILDVAKQRAKEAVALYSNGLGFPSEHSSLVQGVLDDSSALIDAATNDSEIASVVEKSKALLDLTKAYLDQLVTIASDDPSAQNKRNVLSSAYENASEKVKAAESSEAIATARDNGLTSINGAISNAHRLHFYENYKEILEKDGITSADLEAINAAITAMKNGYTADEQSTLDDYRDLLITKKKTAVTDAITSLKNGSAFDTEIDGYVTEIAGLDILGGTDEDNAVSERLDAIYALVSDTVEINNKRQAARAELLAKLNELKNSGRYSASQKTELETKLDAALDALDALTLDTASADSVLGTFKTETVAKLMEVKVSYIANGELNASAGNSDKDYGKGYNAVKDGLWAIVKNENGMPGASVLTSETGILKPFTLKGYKAVTGTFDDAKALNAVDEKKALISVNIKIKNGESVFTGESNGIYTVTLLLPEDLRSATGLQVISYDAAGDTLIYDTRKEGNLLIFETDVLTEFTVIGDRTVNLTWVAVLLGGIFLIEIISTVIVTVKRKKANGDGSEGGEKMYSFMLPILAVVFTPAGIIPALVVLGALSVVGGGVLAVQVKKSVSKPASKGEQLSEDEATENNVTDIATENVESVSEEAPVEVAEEQPDEATEEPEVAEVEETEAEPEATEEVAEEQTEEVTEESEVAEVEETETEPEAAEEVAEEQPDEATEEPEVAEVEETETEPEAAEEVAEEQPEKVTEEPEVAEVEETETEPEAAEEVAEEPEVAEATEIEAVTEPVIEESADVAETEEANDVSKKVLILPVVGGEAEDEEEDPVDETDDGDEEEIPVALPDDAEGDDEEDKKVFSGIFGDRIYVVYDYSFESKLVQSSEDVQRRYYELSELLLSYKIKKRRSWKKERYFLKGKNYVQMIFRGKTLCLCMAIAPESLEGTKYTFENVGEVKKYESVPVMVRIRSGRGCKYAAELIKMMLDEAGIPQKYQPEDKFEPLPYEDKQQLIDRGAVKMLMTDGSGDVVNADFEAMKNGKFSMMNEGMPIMKRVSAEDVAAIPDEAATPFVETEIDNDDEITYGRRKGIVNIDTISAAFSDGDVVTINALKAKHLVPKNIHFVKILARGILDKPLTVKAHDFSMDAVKMIVIAGGNVVKLKSKRI